MKITAAVVEHKGGKFHMRDDIDLYKLGATDVRVHEKVGAAVSNFKPVLIIDKDYQPGD
jgi:hypothetical protein